LWTALVALSIGSLTFVYRFNTLGGPLAGFDNDHFFQIVRAEAMLDGELPLRDYSEAELRSLWPQLTYASSAAAMQTMGRTLRSEAILDVGMLALGASATVWAAATVAGSVWPAALMTLLGVGLSPTLYNYPKIVLYAFAVIAFLAYAQRPGILRLVTLAVIEVVATLYRHDHGVYLGVAIAALLLFCHGRTSAKPLLRFAAFVAIGLAPGLLFVQLHGGLMKYVRECLETSRREVRRTAAPSFGFSIDTSRRLIERAPAPPAPVRRIAIRWAGLSTDVRARAEQDLGLSDRQPRRDDQNWSYAIEDPSSTRLAAIVHDPRVADTDGVDRDTFTLTGSPPPVGRGGLFGWRIAPGLFRAANAGPWLRLVAWGVVLTSFVCLFTPLRDRAVPMGVPRAAIIATAALTALLCFVFLRNAADYRLPDPSVPIAILGSWLCTALPRLARPHSRATRGLTAALLTIVLVFSALSVGVVGSVPEQVTGTGARLGLSGVTTRWRELWGTLGALPDSLMGIDDDLAAASRYIRRCTQPADRLLVADERPEINYFARRPIAAGQIVFFGGFYTSDEAQRETLDRWRRQDVRMALVPSGDRFAGEFAKDYPLVADYLRAHYQNRGTLDVERGNALDIWVDSRVPWMVDADTQLPCRASGS
jgi:hypothetical protein